MRIINSSKPELFSTHFPLAVHNYRYLSHRAQFRVFCCTSIEHQPGSSSLGYSIHFTSIYSSSTGAVGLIAQLVEHFNGIAEVMGQPFLSRTPHCAHDCEKRSFVCYNPFKLQQGSQFSRFGVFSAPTITGIAKTNCPRNLFRSICTIFASFISQAK